MFAAIRANAARGATVHRVRFRIEIPFIRLSLSASAAHLFCGGVYLAELYEVVIYFTTNFRNESALMADVLGPRALMVSAVAHLTHKTESLRTTSEAANERGRTLVLPAPHFDSRIRSHDSVILTRPLPYCLGKIFGSLRFLFCLLQKICTRKGLYGTHGSCR